MVAYCSMMPHIADETWYYLITGIIRIKKQYYEAPTRWVLRLAFRFLRPSLFLILCRWDSIVRVDKRNKSAISLVFFPSLMKLAT